jgi:hypothetical protein
MLVMIGHTIELELVLGFLRDLVEIQLAAN